MMERASTALDGRVEFLSLRAGAQASPESLLPRVVATQAGIVLGLVMLLVLLLVLHDRRRAIPGAPPGT